MIVWLIRDLEPIPSEPGNRRLMRMGMLAQALAGAGHTTRWITSSFDHYQKRQRAPRAQEIVPQPGLTITVLPGPGYRKNLSLGRIRHNRVFAKAFARFAKTTSERPDIIVTDIPTTEAAASAVAFGKTNGIPTVLSIRDLWPDFFTDHLPALLRPLARLALVPLERQARFACANATSLVGISPAYLEWGRKKGARAPAPTDRIFPLGYAPRPAPQNAVARSILDRIGVRPDARVVAFIGSWGHTYDLPLVLETARTLSDRSDIQFVIAGDGPQASALVPHFAELPNVRLPGWLDADDIAIVLRRADIGLLPYRADAPQGLPNKAFEYLAYGAYQIATIAGELEPFYRETAAGRALAQPDAEALAAAIVSALSDPEITSSRATRVAYFGNHFDAGRVYSQMVDHIVAMAASGPSNR
ncbi:glycosyltransferase family 4 protein [Pelagibacterium xiamenense]|uniref:glycosyltransferase family 4 protein n=1 Tax=Pelagibacterium xiamenense TaxID=2901140 RepID=UPI001E64A562|nr:glycosyltransferase family 4 protein [Pelagibacterium xiamenense]MCD7061412.1 glycosyltransferase family 4 protein [Pelagibacterium xiamenense]